MLTQNQQAFLDQFEVVRLKACSVTKEHLELFHVQRESTLPKYLRENALRDDTAGQSAVYLIRHKTDARIAAFFSLHCGSLFEGFKLSELIQTRDNCIRDFIDDYQLSGGSRSDDELRQRLAAEHDEANNFLSELDESLKFKFGKTRRINRKISSFFDDDKMENKRADINRVKDTFPSLELVHFCVDSDFKNQWKKLSDNDGIRYTLGSYFYWKHVIPIVFKVCDLVGCRYLFLFAADDSPDGTLVNHYKTSFAFSEPKEHGVSKPYYDWKCKFLSVEISRLKEERVKFLTSLNASDANIV